MGVKKTLKKEAPQEVETANMQETTSSEPEVEVTEPEVEVTEPSIESGVSIDSNAVEVNPDAIPEEKNVRVKLLKDTKFNFGTEMYDLKEGQCYNVPKAVKLHLNKLGVLSPL